MKDGDIFRWSWKPEMGRDNHAPYGGYHCYSRIAIFDGDKLRDTFWGSGNDAKTIRPDQVDLTLLGNKHEMRQIRCWDEPYYNPKDLVLMRHRNNTNAPTYLKPGAEKDAETIRDNVLSRLDTAIAKKESAEREVRRWQEALAHIGRGQIDKVVF